MKKTVLSIIAAVLLSTPSFAWGWAHRVIGYVAQEHCTPATREVLDRYLDSPLNNVAMWPDIFRCRLWVPQDYSDAPDYTFKSWEHAVCVGPDYYPLKESNRPDGNGTGYGAILGYIERLQNYKEMTDSAVVVDMTALVHMVGDNHCPGHILYSKPDGTWDPMGGGIAGGYGTYTHKFKGRKVTLHSIIDGSDAIHSEFEKNLDLWKDYLDGRYWENRHEILSGGVGEWLQDAAIRSKVIYEWVKPGQDLDDSFYSDPEHEALLSYLFAAASYRLAHIFNTLFDPEYRGL